MKTFGEKLIVVPLAWLRSAAACSHSEVKEHFPSRRKGSDTRES